MSEKLYHGVCWYPELWDEAVWAQDIAQMQKMGINLVRIGEFAWSTLEAQEGCFDFSLLQKAAQMLHSAGMDFIMCTPTPTPPVWLTHGHPECCHKDARGVMSHGARLHVCLNNPEFERYAARITEKLAEAFADMPGLVLWQLDNEIKSHVGNCWCDACKAKWHQWLQKRYGSVEVLNEAWGTTVFSETYQSFEQVPQPLTTPFLHNASLLTNYNRFTMESAADFIRAQANIIRKYSKVPVTTNGSINFHMNFSEAFAALDAAAYDTYPSQANHAIYLMNHDFWRNIKPGKKHWLLETTCLHTGHLEHFAEPLPRGYLAAEAAAAYAQNAQSFCYWLWRQHHNGCEINHSALISAWGKPTAGYAEAEKAEEARKQIAAAVSGGTLEKPEIALCYSDVARAYFDTEKLKDAGYTGLVREMHKHIFHSGYRRDVLTESNSWDGYKLVWTPFMPYVDDETLAKAKSFVENGGIWICGPMTGHRGKEHDVHRDYGLGRLEEVFEFRTRFIAPLNGASGELFGIAAPLQYWGFSFEPQGLIPRAYVQGGCMDGEIFAAEKKLGKGKLVLLGALPAEEDGARALEAVVAHYAVQADVEKTLAPSRGVDVAKWNTPGGTVYIAVNMDAEPGYVMYGEKQIKLAPYAYEIIH